VLKKTMPKSQRMGQKSDKVLEKIEEIYDVERIEEILDDWWSTGGIEFRHKVVLFHSVLWWCTKGTGLPERGFRIYRTGISKMVMEDGKFVSSRYQWSGREDLNLRLPAPKAGALPGCATPRFRFVFYHAPFSYATTDGFAKSQFCSPRPKNSLIP
jgi:hypothetical protein